MYAATRKAVLPQCTLLLGPLGSGKSTIGKHMAARTNAKLVDFCSFVTEKGLEGQSDEILTTRFIKYLAQLP